MTLPHADIEFSRPYPVERLGDAEATETIKADALERARLAERFRIVSVDDLAATIRLARVPGGLVRVEGRLEANVVQTCVVTLDPFPSHVEDSFTADFGDAEKETEPGREISLDFEHEPPEPIRGGIIDLGELVAQFLALALDPHPRAPGVALEQVWSETDNAPASPFAVLEKLKMRD